MLFFKKVLFALISSLTVYIGNESKLAPKKGGGVVVRPPPDPTFPTPLYFPVKSGRAIIPGHLPALSISLYRYLNTDLFSVAAPTCKSHRPLPLILASFCHLMAALQNDSHRKSPTKLCKNPGERCIRGSNLYSPSRDIRFPCKPGSQCSTLRNAGTTDRDTGR